MRKPGLNFNSKPLLFANATCTATQRAHNAGALHGTVGVAKMTLKGEGGLRNLTKALEYYNNAANRSSTDALNGLGYMYFYGDPVPKNESQALAYFRRGGAVQVKSS